MDKKITNTLVRKIIFVVLLLVIAIIVTRAFIRNPHPNVSNLSVAEQNKLQYDATKNPYNMIKVGALGANQTLGKILTIDPSKIVIGKIEQYKCFHVVDIYDEHTDAKGLSAQQIDQTYNTEMLPWCNTEDSYEEDTAEGFTFNIDSRTAFLIAPNPTNTSKEVFMNYIKNQEPHLHVIITANGTTATQIMILDIK